MIIEVNSVVDVSGKVVLLTSATTWVLEWFGGMEFNDITTGAVSIAGFVYLILKIQGQLLENKEKRKRLNED